MSTHHYSLYSRSSGVWVAVFVLLVWHFLRSNPAPHPLQLKDQPNYSQPAPCQATVCNSAKRCSQWHAGLVVSWSVLAEHAIYRDVASIQVDPGCQVRLQVDRERPQPEKVWMTVESRTSCISDGVHWVPDCRNVVALEVKASLPLVLSQLKRAVQDQPGEEVVLSYAPLVSAANVTLVTQFSVNRLEAFDKVLEAWKGPVSVAIYLTEANDIVTLDSYFKKTATLTAYENVTLTLIKPIYTTKDHLAYPINHLRNIAWTASTTDYVLVIDADFVPSPNLFSFLESNTHLLKAPNSAWIVPCFGLRGSQPLPKNINELRTALRHSKAFITDPGAGHGPTLAEQLGMSHAYHLYDTVCYESQWEPYYVVSRHSPLYDVRFKNQGGDKQSHALQLNAEAYRFYVWRNVFLVHQDHPHLVWPKQAKPQWGYFEEFMREMESLYGMTVRWPRGCNAMGVGWQEQNRATLGWGSGAV